MTTFSESKKGQELGLYIKTVPNLTSSEVGLRFDIWQENMVNCCQFELKWKTVGSSIMLVLLPDGLYLKEFSEMLRNDDACFSFMVENVEMLCKGKRVPYVNLKIQPQNIAKNLTLAFGLSRIVMFQPGFRYYILGHPDWDEDRPGRNLEGMKWEKKQADQIKTEKRKRATVWKKGL